MATYIQGVTDFIPDYQPFQPDLNFYSNLLQAKQTQYDTNWKSINKLYGQLYGADLTHDLNIEKKDKLLQQIDFNLKRTSGLDLSLEQNVTQATQVFKPFYEDRYLMKDMAWTKNFRNTYAGAEALRTSADPEQRKQWWSTGVEGMNIRRQMFKDATLDETLNMANVRYTPDVKVNEEYMNLAKKFNVGAVTQLPDESGLYLVRKKNGELILPTLQNMFLAEYINRPDIQDKYREKAFVERMNYAYQNADKFGGNKLESEKEYIKQKYEYLKTYAAEKNGKAQDELKTTENLKGNLEKDIKEGNVNPQQYSYADRLNLGLKVNTVIADNAQKLDSEINTKSTDLVKTSDDDILNDLELARLKVDAGFASINAEQDIMSAANAYAMVNYEVEYKANPIGLENLRHRNASARDRQVHNNKLEEMRIKSEYDMFGKAVDNLVEKNYWRFDPNTGKLDKNPQNGGFNLVNLELGAGSNTDGTFTFDDLQKLGNEQLISQNATEPVNNLMTMIQNGVDSGSFTSAQLATFVKQFNPSNKIATQILKEGSTAANLVEIKKAWSGIWSEFKTNAPKFTNTYASSGQIYNVNDVMRKWSASHSGSGLSKQYFGNENMIKLEQLARTTDALSIVEDQNFTKIKNKFSQDLSFIVSKIKTQDPKLYASVTEAKMQQAVDLMMRKYTLDGNGNLEDFKALAPEVDKAVSSILGFDVTKNTNQERTSKWYNYVFPLTNVTRLFGDGRENVKDKASWSADVFDISFEELLKDNNPATGLTSYFTNINKQSGNKFALGTETGIMMVAPGVTMDPGNRSANQMFTTILSTNWNQNGNKYRITTEGNKLPGSIDEETGIEQTEALAIVRDIQQRLNTDKKLMPFGIGATTISMESNDLGSMKLMAPRELIETVIKGMADPDAKANELDAKIDKIYQKGITFIAPKPLWESNQLFGDQFQSPVEVLLNKGPIKYNDPGGNGGYIIEKKPGSDDYRGIGTFYQLNEDGSKTAISQAWDVGVRSGKTIDQKEQIMHTMLRNTAELNFAMFNKIHKSGDQKRINTAVQNFGFNPLNPFYNYNN